MPSLSAVCICGPVSKRGLVRTVTHIGHIFKSGRNNLIISCINVTSTLGATVGSCACHSHGGCNSASITGATCPRFRGGLSIYHSLVCKFSCNTFFNGSSLRQTGTVDKNISFVRSPRQVRAGGLCVGRTLLLQRTLSLYRDLLGCRRHVRTTCFRTIHALLAHIRTGNGVSFHRVGKHVGRLLGRDVGDRKMVGLFSSVGRRFSLFSSGFLRRITQVGRQGFTMRLLHELVTRRMRLCRQAGAMQTRGFSRVLTSTVDHCLGKVLAGRRIVRRLLGVTHRVIRNRGTNGSLGLGDRRLTFCSTLAGPRTMGSFCSGSRLITVAQRLASTLQQGGAVS